MTTLRYRVDDLPAQGAGAFLPTLTLRPSASSWGLVHVAGAPGTMAVDAPYPQRQFGGVVVSADKKTAPSYAGGVEAILPSIYVASVKNMGPQQGADGVLVRHHENVPVPAAALAYVRVAKPVQRRQRTTGSGTTAWPRAFQRWNRPPNG